MIWPLLPAANTGAPERVLIYGPRKEDTVPALGTPVAPLPSPASTGPWREILFSYSNSLKIIEIFRFSDLSEIDRISQAIQEILSAEENDKNDITDFSEDICEYVKENYDSDEDTATDKEKLFENGKITQNFFSFLQNFSKLFRFSPKFMKKCSLIVLYNIYFGIRP